MEDLGFKKVLGGIFSDYTPLTHYRCEHADTLPFSMSITLSLINVPHQFMYYYIQYLRL